jgi:hypothetical protein
MRIIKWMLAAIFTFIAHTALSMDITVKGHTVIMTRSVVGFECADLRNIISKSEIQNIILENSRGGNAAAGYCVGSLIRENGISTSINGSCSSSCSRMWLGGISRTLIGNNSRVGLHRNYRGGWLLSDAPSRLRSWIPRYATSVDRNLMEQWINLPTNKNMMYFYNDRAELCDHDQCTPIPKRNARNVGLSTN